MSPLSSRTKSARSGDGAGGLFRVEHQLLSHKLSLMREVDLATGAFRHSSSRFRQLIHECSIIMGVEVTRDLVVTGPKPAIVPIIRAGLTMVEGVLQMMPAAKMGHLGLHRGRAEITQYLVALPDSEGRKFFVLDPVIGTGNIACRAIQILNEHSVAESDITYVTIVAAPEGLAKIKSDHPGVRVYFADLASGLDDQLRVMPGWGDASNRASGIKELEDDQ